MFIPRALPGLSHNIGRFCPRAFGTHASLPIGNFSYKWLRDSCPSAESIHPTNLQKLHRTTDVIKDAKPKSVNEDKDGLRIEWESGHKSFYPTEYLASYSSNERRAAFHHDVRPQPWNLAKISANDQLFIPYDSFQTDAGRLAAITQLQRDGLVFIQGVPNTETSNETCEVRRVAEAFGEIRDTLYGPVWDVINKKNSRNIAYTNIGLGLHMDLLSVCSILARFACCAHLRPGTSSILPNTSSSIVSGIWLKVVPRYSWTLSTPRIPCAKHPPLTSIYSPQPPYRSTISTMVTISTAITPQSNLDSSPTRMVCFQSNS